MNNIKYLIILVVVAAVAFSAGKFLSPAKVITKEVEKIVYKETKNTQKDNHTNETRKETHLPDGTVIIEYTKNSDTKTKIDDKKNSEIDKINEKIIENRPDWRLGVIYDPILVNKATVYQGVVEKRLFSEIYVGVSASTDQHYGLAFSIGF